MITRGCGESLDTAGNPATIKRVLVALAIVLFAGQAVLFMGSRLDDPYIFARYASNLSRFGDVVWNPGEPRIEGFSSWVWLFVYLAGTNSVPDPVVFARVVGLIAGVALVVAFGRAVLKSPGSAWPGAAALAVVSASPDLAFIATSGMDHALWSLSTWLFLAWLAGSERVGVRHACVAALGILVRPEGFLWFAPLGTLLVAQGAEDRGRALVPRTLRSLAPGLAVLAALFLARWLAFDAWLPNAAAAKHAGGSIPLRIVAGLLYCGHAFGLYIAGPLIVFAAVAASGRRLDLHDRDDRVAFVCLVWVVVLTAFVVAAGGDDTAAFGPARLLTPAVAPAGYLLAWGLRRLPAPGSEAVRALIVVGILLVARAPAAKEALQAATRATTVSSPSAVLTAWHAGLRPAPRLPISDYLVRETPAGESIAVGWAGLVPYQTGLPVIDILGLNDREIRNNPATGRVAAGGREYADEVLRRQPYFICEVFVIRESLADVSAMSDEALYARGVFLPAQRSFLRDPRLAAGYRIDPAAPTAGTCFRRKENAAPTQPTSSAAAR
jgi:arabinofuranosyltransferase